MPPVTLCGLLDSRPNAPFWGRPWVAKVLARYIGGEDGGPTLRGWKLGRIIGRETLVQSRPTLSGHDVDPVDDFLRSPAHCTLAAFASEGDEDAKQRITLPLSRFRRHIGLISGPRLSESQRTALRAELPDFLKRAPNYRTDADVTFLRLLAELHERGALSTPVVQPTAVRDALHALSALLPEGPLNVFVGDGRTLGILHRGGTLLGFTPPRDSWPSRLPMGGIEGGAPAGLYLWHHGPPPQEPFAGAERISEGVISIEVRRPASPVRSP